MEMIKNASNDYFIIAQNYSTDKQAGTLTPGHVESLEKVLTNLREVREGLTKDRARIFYPKKMNSDLKINKAGLEEAKDATEFLAAAKSSRQITEKLCNCLEMNQIDFASTIFEKLVHQIPKSEAEFYNLDRTDPDKVNLYRVIRGMYKVFCDRYAVNNIDHDLKLIAEIEVRAKNLKDEINKEIKSEVSNAN